MRLTIFRRRVIALQKNCRLKFICLQGLLLLSIFAILFVACDDSAIKKGETCLILGDYNSAIDFFSGELKKNPADCSVREGLGKAYLQKAANHSNDTLAWGLALIHLEAARTLHPTEKINSLLCDAWLERARLYLSGQDTLKALEALTRAIEMDSRKTEPVNLAAILYFGLGQTDRAEKLFKKGIALDSTQASTHFNLGMVYWAQKNYADAHRQWLNALKLSPKDEDILYWFAVAEKNIRKSP